MSDLRAYKVAGAGHILISNRVLIQKKKYNGKLVEHLFPVIFWRETKGAVPTIVAAATETAVQMTGISLEDAGSALADTLESMVINYAWDVGYIHDKYPRDPSAWAMYETHARRHLTHNFQKFVRTGDYTCRTF